MSMATMSLFWVCASAIESPRARRAKGFARFKHKIFGSPAGSHVSKKKRKACGSFPPQAFRSLFGRDVELAPLVVSAACVQQRSRVPPELTGSGWPLQLAPVCLSLSVVRRWSVSVPASLGLTLLFRAEAMGTDV